MAPIKSAIYRSLRSALTNTNSRLQKSVNRGLTATSQNSIVPNTQLNRQTPNLLPRYPLNERREQNSILDRTPIFQPRIQTKSTAFDELLNAITTSLTTTTRPQLPYLHSLLRSYTSNPAHWSKYAHANPEKQYTRNLVCEVPGLFNLLLLVWTPGKESPVHDHADAHCLMKVLKGEIRERRFATPERPGEQGPLVQTSNVGFGLNKVSYMTDELGLHAISNPHPTEYAATLHLYTPPNAAMRGCHVFGTENGEARHVMQSAYDSIKGEVS